MVCRGIASSGLSSRHVIRSVLYAYLKDDLFSYLCMRIILKCSLSNSLHVSFFSPLKILRTIFPLIDLITL